MSLEYFEQDVEAVRNRAEEFRRSHENYTAAVATDPKLSDEGRLDARTNSYQQIRPELDALRAKEEQLIQDKIVELERRIDSTAGTASSDIIAFRDAHDRAERIEDAEDARRMLERALRQNDKTLAHAIFRRANESGWGDVTTLFTNSYPDIAGVVNDLAKVTAFRDNTMARTAHYAIFR